MADLRARAVSGLGRLYPLASGCGMLASSPPYRVLAATMHWPATARLRGGAQVLCNNDHVGRAAYFFGDLDPKVSWVVRRVLRRGDTFLDVGANIGVVSLLAASIVGPQGAVHAFEPQEELAGMQADSARLNGFPQLTVHGVALSDEDGTAVLAVPPDNLGAASLSGAPPGSETRMVAVRRAADMLLELAPEPVRMMKIDIEGHEDQFFRGARPYLEQHPPTVVLFEEHRSGAQEGTVDLQALGYDVFELPRALLRPVPRRTAPGAHDRIAVHADAPPALRRRLRLPS